MKKIVIAIVLLISFLSCKNDKKDINNKEQEDKIEENSLTEKTKQEDKLNIEFNAVIESDMELFLRYTQNETLSFSPKDFVKVKVKGSSELQKVSFVLPNGIYPTNMRINFKGQGNNAILLNNVSFNMEGKSVEISNNNIWSYFAPNLSTSFDQKTNTFKDKNETNKSLPGIIFRAVLIKKLEESVF